jgi:hypothetical protein
MPQNQLNSVIVTASGVFGGVGKAISSHFVLINITIHGTVELAFYAAISATVAYGVKEGIDYMVKRYKSRKRK